MLVQKNTLKLYRGVKQGKYIVSSNEVILSDAKDMLCFKKAMPLSMWETLKQNDCVLCRYLEDEGRDIMSYPEHMQDIVAGKWIRITRGYNNVIFDGLNESRFDGEILPERRDLGFFYTRYMLYAIVKKEDGTIIMEDEGVVV